MTYNKRFNKKSIKRRFSKKLKKKSTRRIKRGGSQNTTNYLAEAEYDNFFKKFEGEANEKFPSDNCNSDFEINKINTDIDDFFENQKEKFKRVLENKIKCNNSETQFSFKPNYSPLNNNSLSKTSTSHNEIVNKKTSNPVEG